MIEQCEKHVSKIFRKK